MRFLHKCRFMTMGLWEISQSFLHYSLMMQGCLCSVWPFPKIWEILVKKQIIAVIWFNEGTIQIFSKAGSFIWWLMRIFQVFLIFSIRVHYVCVLYTKNVIVKYSHGIHHAGCQNVCCSKYLTGESITK